MDTATPAVTAVRLSRTTNYFDEDGFRLLATARYQGRWIVRGYGPDESVEHYSEWTTRGAAENVARRYAESVA